VPIILLSFFFVPDVHHFEIFVKFFKVLARGGRVLFHPRVAPLQYCRKRFGGSWEGGGPLVGTQLTQKCSAIFLQVRGKRGRGTQFQMFHSI